jgi:hypothetical protein
MQTQRKGAGFEPGAIVRHSGAFLRSVGWLLDVPINGLVHGAEAFGFGQLLDVEWSDGTRCKILASNVEPCPRARRAAECSL